MILTYTFLLLTCLIFEGTSGTVHEPGNNAIQQISPITFSAKNMTMEAGKLKLSNDAFVARNVTIKADSFSLSNFGTGHHHGKRQKPKPPYQLISDPDLSASINKLVNPCDDFYHYVCDGWIASHHPLPYESSIDQFDVNDRKLKKQIDWIFKNRDQFDDTRLTHLMFTYYEKCSNMTARNDMKSQPVFDMLRKIRQTSPQNATDWLIAIAPLSTIYTIAVMKDVLNVTQNQLVIISDSTYINGNYYVDKKFEKERRALRKYLSDLLGILENDDTEHEFFHNDTAERRIETFMDLQTAIAEINSASKDRYLDNMRSAYNMYPLDKVQELVPVVDWQRYLENLLPMDVQNDLNFSTLQLNTLATEVFVDIGKTISNLSETQLADYFEWKIILSSVKYLDERYRNTFKALAKALYGSSELTPNWILCQSRATDEMPEVFNRIYISTFFNRSSKPILARMVGNIKDAFAEVIKNEKWMDDVTRKRALKKVRAIIPMIAYNDLIFNDTIVDELYEDLDFNDTMTYFKIVQTLRQYDNNDMFEDLLLLNERTDFTFPAPTVNAGYIPTSNQIALFVGILQGAFFNLSLPLPMNYGGIGAVIGHEITHGFDDEGRQYNAVGDLDDWWDNKTLERYLELKKCFVDQYGPIVVPDTGGMKIDGVQTQGENIADNGGVRAAYTAMKKAIGQDNYKRKRIAGLEKYTDEQLFFINYAYIYCGSTRPKAAIESLLSDVHSPEQYRVNIPLGNMDSFFEAFNCPYDCAMRPKKQCRLF